MPKYLVIVESPAKAKTIEKYLGKDFHVMASYGHVRDLVPKEGAVDPDHDFEMKYQIIDRNSKHVDAIRKALKTCDGLYLAPDPDREGEAIAWHLQQILLDAGALKNKTSSRVVFHQITKNAVQEAMKNPRDISMDLVNAQQARRALDYLVGFRLSPLLWRKVRPGLSAGRVQSPALRLIVERELEIEKFITQEYWTIHAELLANAKKKSHFSARLTHLHGEKVEQFDIADETKSKSVCDTLIKSAKGKCTVAKVTKKERKRHPAAPFTTSTLQQEASRKLGFSAQRTMQVAQQLYEGIDTGEGATGLITYMRTDSVTLAQEALEDLRHCIGERFGKSFVPDEARVYKTKSKNAQEAHEAIRPTSALRNPLDIKSALTPEQYKLYDLIWKRAIASQMIDATLDTVAVDLAVGDGTFRANGSTITNPGFISVYQEDFDDKKNTDDDDNEKILPPLEEGQVIPVDAITGEQHFTEPPPRFSEASLVKALEEFGIGRPSTYASIIATLKNREYVEMDNKRFKPTDVGRIVNRFLTTYFTMYVDYHFTAKLEDDLDAVSCGEMDWIPVLQHFWSPFKDRIEDVQENVKRSDVTQEPLDENCPKCGKQLSIRLGKRGRFVGCSGYPECDFTRNLDGEDTSTPETIEGRVCPECESPLIIRHGKYGKFIGCSSYPKCKHIESLEQPEDTKVSCPKCKEGHIVKRKSRRGKVFFSCNRYPDCDYALWYPPINEPCPQCHWPILMMKTTKTKGDEKVCPQKECGYATPAEES